MKFSLTFDCDNAAFEGAYLLLEIDRILEVTRRRIKSRGLGALPMKLTDLNGNTVGEVKLTGKRAKAEM
jgi:hypothetical protein